jgi:tetratricopeptide (TPR) repeat protein
MRTQIAFGSDLRNVILICMALAGSTILLKFAQVKEIPLGKNRVITRPEGITLSLLLLLPLPIAFILNFAFVPFDKIVLLDKSSYRYKEWFTATNNLVTALTTISPLSIFTLFLLRISGRKQISSQVLDTMSSVGEVAAHISIPVQKLLDAIDRGEIVAYRDRVTKVDLNSALSWTHIWEGITFAEQGQYDDAIQCLEHAISTSPQEAHGYILRGKAYYCKGMLTEATQDFKMTLRIDPGLAEAFYMLKLAKKGLIQAHIG